MKQYPYIIIPDVHGRNFWEPVVEQYLDTDTIFIFLGDYLDAYPYEDIHNEFDAIQSILSYKRQFPDRFILLLGNHDLHYLTRNGRGSRWDYIHAERNAKVFNDNAELFQMVYSCVVNNKRFYFSHAGILKGWLYKNANNLHITVPDHIEYYDDWKINDWTELPDFNHLWRNPDLRKDLFETIGDVGFYRGGSASNGSIVWADIHEHLPAHQNIPGIIQVFGHTQQEEDPINYNDSMFCLDCRRAFAINDDGKIVDLNTDKEIPSVNVEEERDKQIKHLEKLMAFMF